jgi:CAAX protease family protein
MRKFLQPLSPGAEFLIVITVAFGFFIVRSLFSAVHPTIAPHHTGHSLNVLVAYELFLLVMLGTFLHLRGWTLARLGLAPTWKDTAIGVGLALAAYAFYVAGWMALVASAPQLAQAATRMTVVASGVSVPTAIALVLVNPLFEEVFVAGYTISALKDTRGESFATNCSVAIRLLYHLYQGVVGVISIIPTGLIFAFWYLRTGRLWPLIVAHAVLDLTGLLQVVKF